MEPCGMEDPNTNPCHGKNNRFDRIQYLQEPSFQGLRKVYFQLCCHPARTKILSQLIQDLNPIVILLPSF